MKKVKVILERGADALWGRIEGGDFQPVTCGESLAQVEESLRVLVADYVEHEGREDDKWKNVDAEKLGFEYEYDLTQFFEDFKFLNVSQIAQVARINESLMRQYAKGIKYPSAERVDLIERTVRELGAKMQRVSLTSRKEAA